MKSEDRYHHLDSRDEESPEERRERLLGEYIPADAERVLEINPRHGRAEILSSVQCLIDSGF